MRNAGRTMYEKAAAKPVACRAANSPQPAPTSALVSQAEWPDRSPSSQVTQRAVQPIRACTAANSRTRLFVSRPAERRRMNRPNDSLPRPMPDRNAASITVKA
ncbi:MAG: hypothetical protein IPH86_14350 [bacterium]|nr:hypothetical protein [bacterium]